MSLLPDINWDRFLSGIKAQVNINRYKNEQKDVGKPMELWGLILGRPMGNLMAAIEDGRKTDIEKYVYEVSAVLAEIHARVTVKKDMPTSEK